MAVQVVRPSEVLILGRHGGGGYDIIQGSTGLDIIAGGKDSDELHGDFGWNTYKDQRDGSTNLITINKSNQHLNNR